MTMWHFNKPFNPLKNSLCLAVSLGLCTFSLAGHTNTIADKNADQDRAYSLSDDSISAMERELKLLQEKRLQRFTPKADIAADKTSTLATQKSSTLEQPSVSSISDKNTAHKTANQQHYIIIETPIVTQATINTPNAFEESVDDPNEPPVQITAKQPNAFEESVDAQNETSAKIKPVAAIKKTHQAEPIEVAIRPAIDMPDLSHLKPRKRILITTTASIESEIATENKNENDSDSLADSADSDTQEESLLLATLEAGSDLDTEITDEKEAAKQISDLILQELINSEDKKDERQLSNLTPDIDTNTEEDEVLNLLLSRDESNSEPESSPVIQEKEIEPPMSSFYSRLVKEALQRTKHRVRYDGRYRYIKYPWGDVPKSIGVCTDVVIRAYRKMGIDLQQLVHHDISKNFHLYPSRARWGLKRPDPNIDHRRVYNLQVFFKRFGQTLPITHRAKDYKPGDLVTWQLGPKLPHIGVVVNKKSPYNKDHYMIVHNIGRGPQIEDILFSFPITGHYRYKPNKKMPRNLGPVVFNDPRKAAPRRRASTRATSAQRKPQRQAALTLEEQVYSIMTKQSAAKAPRKTRPAAAVAARPAPTTNLSSFDQQAARMLARNVRARRNQSINQVQVIPLTLNREPILASVQAQKVSVTSTKTTDNFDDIAAQALLAAPSRTTKRQPAAIKASDTSDIDEAMLLLSQ